MGSLRNPVGPLPSSIYWRRRVLLLSVMALLALIALWFVISDGGGGGNGAGGGDAKNPTASITPGPSGSGPAISQAPGGRDDSGGGSGGSGGTSGSDGSSGSAGAAGSSGSSGSGDTGSGGNGSGGSGGSAGSGGKVVAGDALPAGSALPNCGSGAVRLSLRSAHNTYAPGEKPSLLLTAENTSGADCKIDLGPKNAVVAISESGKSGDYWSSDDCPKGARSLVFKVPAHDAVTYTVKWDLKPSSPQCATPPAGSARAGTYLVEAEAPGFAKAQTSFVIEKD
ncbi:hypothetical protein ACIPEL_33260 [Streptomyces griseoviridis]